MTASEAVTLPVVGLVLAAGSGSRLGGPKALITNAAGETWLARTVSVLRDGGCGSILVVLGSEADEVHRHLPSHARAVVAQDWADGMGASLRSGLGALVGHSPGASAVVVMLVDTPDVSADVVRRLLATGWGPGALGRSAYDGVVGHPVLIGRQHWAGVIASAAGDRGARDYLAARDVLLVECGDLAQGTDVDTPEALEAWLEGDPFRG